MTDVVTHFAVDAIASRHLTGATRIVSGDYCTALADLERYDAAASGFPGIPNQSAPSLRAMLVEGAGTLGVPVER